MAIEKPYKKLVMLVDDNETDNFIHRRVLEMGNFSENIIVKNSGKSALEYLEANQSNPDLIPEVIFLDINMPIVDGFVFLFEFES
ncbi:MAG: response regulator, partial [Cytophaga sp.]|uniref:response regulator n=1 Tax=Cytophaga sp. TaxID=29535 RepID=UPI003F81F2A3